MSNKEIAQTILNQLGGNRFIAMTGASSFSYGDKTLSFSIGSNPKKVKAVRITLEPSDTYKMEFLAIRKMEVKTLSEKVGVYCDMLQEIFTNETGLYTKL